MKGDRMMRVKLFVRYAFFFIFVFTMIGPAGVQAIQWTYYDENSQQLVNPTAEEVKGLAHIRVSEDKTQYALRIEHKFDKSLSSGYLENIGNPSPGVGLTWIDRDDNIVCEVDGIVEDPFKLNTRYVTTGYRGNKPVNQGLNATALQFDGNDDYAKAENINLERNFSVEFTAKRNRLNAEEYIISQGTAETDKGFQIGFDQENNFVFHVYGYDPVIVENGPKDMVPHKWHVSYQEYADHSKGDKVGYKVEIQCDGESLHSQTIPPADEQKQESFTREVSDYYCFKILDCNGQTQYGLSHDQEAWSAIADVRNCRSHWGTFWHSNWNNDRKIPASLCGDGGYSKEDGRCNDEYCYCKGEKTWGEAACKEIWYDKTYEARSWFGIWKEVRRWGVKETVNESRSVTVYRHRNYDNETQALHIGKGLSGKYFNGQLNNLAINGGFHSDINYKWRFTDGRSSSTAKASFGGTDARLYNFNTNVCWIMKPAAEREYLFDDIALPRQSVSFNMTSSAKLVYGWKRQYAVSVNTLPDTLANFPIVRVTSASGQSSRSGSGKYWYNEGTELSLTSGKGTCLDLVGYRDNIVNAVETISKEKFEPEPLSKPVSLTWVYESFLFEETVILGGAVTFGTVPSDKRTLINMSKHPRYISQDVPESDMYYWSDPEKLMYPIRGDAAFDLEYDMIGTECAETKLNLRVVVEWPESPHYIHAANTPQVDLDPLPDDHLAFKRLSFTTEDGQATGKSFSATRPGKSVLLFTRNYPVPGPLPTDISLSFEQNDGYVDGGLIEFGENFTIEFWAKRASTGRHHIIAGHSPGQQTDPGFAIGFSADNRFRFGYDSNDLETAQAYTDDSWTHWACVHQDGKRTIFRNGARIAEDTGPVYSRSRGDLYIGRAASDEFPLEFHGQIDEIRIWNIVRSEADILNNKDLRLAGTETGLARYWRMDDLGDVSLRNDASGSVARGRLTRMDPSYAWGAASTAYSLSPEEVPSVGYAHVRVVETISAETSERQQQYTTCPGDEITSPYHHDSVPHNGYVYWDLCPYNADIYDRSSLKGSIYSVNDRHPNENAKDDILVVWYLTQDNIAWPYKPTNYAIKWPSIEREHKNRIVIAARLGSEGKECKTTDSEVNVHSGSEQTWPDMNGVERNYFDPARYSEIKIYNQPSSTLPGYNPNEEHALVAPSFRHSAASPRPQAAFALRNDLNIEDSENYTSEPFVLVQYFDLVKKRHGMSAFRVEKEDPDYGYTFDYEMKAGDPVVAPYPLDTVIGATPPSEIFGKNSNAKRICYWEDHKGQPWAISGVGKSMAIESATPVDEQTYKIQFHAENTLETKHLYIIEVAGPTGPAGRMKFKVGESASDVNAAVHVNGNATMTNQFEVRLNPFIPGLNASNFRLRHYGPDDSQVQVLSYFWYPLAPTFWMDPKTPGDGTGDVGKSIAWLPAEEKIASGDDFPSDMLDEEKAVEARYDIFWPEDVPVLKAGETLTFAGGEYRADHTDEAGLPGVLGWAAGQVVFDELNPNMNKDDMDKKYLVRLAQVLEERSFSFLKKGNNDKTYTYPEALEPAAKRVNVVQGMYYFKDLNAGIKNRIFYDPLTKKLVFQGFVNDKTLGDSTLTATPPSVYVLQPNIMGDREKSAITSLEGVNEDFKNAVEKLFESTRNPNRVEDNKYTVGLEKYKDRLDALLETNQSRETYIRGLFTSWLGTEIENQPNRPIPQLCLGPGLALMPNGALLNPDDPTFSNFSEGYVTLAENNHPDLGAAPVALHIIKIKKEKYRGAVKTIYSDNVFDEKITLRHTADFGANPNDLTFQWRYREEDGTEQPTPDADPEKWKPFPDVSGNNGLGMTEIELKGVGAALLTDNLFYCRYRHKDDPDSWSDWAGAANSRPGDYQPQLAEGWVKRVLNGINPFEARIRDFYSSDSPATYTSMIRQAGQRYEGAVAFNPAKDVIENVGLIELYQTVLDRATSLSIDLEQPASTSGVVTALLLAGTRIHDFYALLGNEAYNDALDPTIGFGSDSVEYGSLAPTIFTFMNQVPSLLDEELQLLRGRDEKGARPCYNRLLWNFTKAQGEAAYALSYAIEDVDKNGFIEEADGRAMYPQGHGDAWGHYMTALKGYYDLLGHPEFNWESRSELFSIEGVVMDVDYFDERKFAETAAAKAKVGADIVNLTYRNRYVEDPDGQWQGYQDADPDRAWGVEGWSRKAFMGAYFDWFAANTLLPSVEAYKLEQTDIDRLEDDMSLDALNKVRTLLNKGFPTQEAFKTALQKILTDKEMNDHGASIIQYAENTGLKKVDRTTVAEFQEIAGQARQIQEQYDHANTGLNPLGLATDVVPFDIDPARTIPGAYNAATQFEQVYERAMAAMENAQVIFNHANDLKNRIRQVANDTEAFTEQVIDQDRDYRNRLIETFGTPYEGTIGSGKVYPAGYKGPDYFLYMYIDVNEVSEETVPQPIECNYDDSDAPKCIRAYFAPLAVTDYEFDKEDGDYNEKDGKALYSQFFKTDTPDVLDESWSSTDFNAATVQIDFPISTGKYSFQAPAEWGMRRSPGEIHQALIELVKAEADLQLAMADYAGLMLDIENATEMLQARSDLNAEELKIGDEWIKTTRTFNGLIMGLRNVANLAELVADENRNIAEACETGLPKVAGLSNDPSFGARATLKIASTMGQNILRGTALAMNLGADIAESEKEIAEMDRDTNLQKAEYKYDVQQQLQEIEALMGNEAPGRLKIFHAKEHMRQVSEKYRAVLAKGLRLMEERKAFNAKVAAKTQGKRYMDMAFRLNLNNALSKYRSMFDLASRYSYLAAKAYDYETNLSDRDPASAKPLLTDIVRQRTLGQYEGDRYVVGRGGLGDILARMNANFAALKGQMGFNNPQTETGRFSLRYERFRVKQGEEYDDDWRTVLQQHRVSDLWAIPEFRKFCRPFTQEDAGFQPGLVIPFATNVIFGKNFFGWPLGGGDHAYDPTNFATKVRSVGVWFDGYDNSQLSETPRAYLIPAGMDVMLVPNSVDLDTREWTVVDQKLPVPLPVGDSDLNNPDWIPSLDSLDGSMTQIRRYSSFRAYHDSGYFDANQMSYDSRLIGRSVWNSRWVLIIPGGTFHYDTNQGLDTFIDTVTDIKLFFQTYAISGGKK